MMKKIALLCAVLLCATALFACGPAKSDLSYDGYNLSDYLTLGAYTGIEVNKLEIEKQLNEQIDAILEANAEDVETNAPAVKGDKILYAMTVTVDGKEVDSLKKTNSSFIIGTSKTVYTELDPHFTGASKSDVFEVTSTIAKDNEDETIAGKEAILKVTINSVTESVVPTLLSDDMIKEYTDSEYTEVEVYKADLTKAIKETLLWNAVMDNVTFKSYPKEKAEYYYNNYLSSYTSTAQQYGMNLATLLQLYGMTEDSFYNTMANNAISQVNQDMTFLAIAEKENIVPTDEKIAEIEAEVVEAYGYKDVKEMNQYIDHVMIEQTAVYELVLEFISEKSVEVEKPLEEEKEESDEKDDADTENSEGTEEVTDTESTDTEAE